MRPMADHLRGAESAFDRALDVGEREGRVAEMRPAQGLLEEDDLVRVAFEEGAIKAIQVVARHMPERVAEAPVQRFGEALPGELVAMNFISALANFALSSALSHCVAVKSAAAKAGIVSARTVAAGSMGRSPR